MTDQRRSPFERRALDSILRGEIQMLHDELAKHIEEERPLLNIVEGMGSAEDIKARVNFVNMLMSRERRKQELHDAVVKGTLTAGLIALLVFLGHALMSYANEVLEIARIARKVKP